MDRSYMKFENVILLFILLQSFMLSLLINLDKIGNPFKRGFYIFYVTSLKSMTFTDKKLQIYLLLEVLIILKSGYENE